MSLGKSVSRVVELNQDDIIRRLKNQNTIVILLVIPTVLS